MALPIYRYPLDPTGRDRNNLVAREPHKLTPKPRITDVRVLIPIYGPFYAESVKLFDKVKARELIPGQDFVCTDLLQDPSLKFAKKISQIIVIKNGEVSNEVDAQYQVLGGNYQNDSTALKHVWETFLNDARAVDWMDIKDKPLTFPPSEHIHLLEDVVGWGPMIVALERVREAILLSNSSIFENFLEWFKFRPVDWNLVINRPTTLEGYGIIDAVHISRRIRTIGGLKGGGTLDKDLTLELTLTGVEPGRYGRRSYYPSVVIDDRGRITSAAEFAINFSDILEKPTTLEGYGITDAVNLWGAQTITGQKTFTRATIQIPTGGNAHVDAYYTAGVDYGAFWRLEGDKFWFLITDKGKPFGPNNAYRPMWCDFTTGQMNFGTKIIAREGVEGNATSASKLEKPVKLSMSGGATAAPKNFDGSVDFDFAVTALDVDKTNAGTLSGLYGGTGIKNFVIGSYFLAETNVKMKQATPKEVMDDIGKQRKIIAGPGTTGGGTLDKDVTITLATPSTLNGTSTNAVSEAGHTHQLTGATSTIAGVVRRSTDAEVLNYQGDGVISPPQLKNLMAPAINPPKPVGPPAAIGTQKRYALEDHVHEVSRAYTNGYNGFEIVNGAKDVSAAEVGKFFIIGRQGASIRLPNPAQFDAAKDTGRAIDAWVLGYDGFGWVSFQGMSGLESYRFYSKITAILAPNSQGVMSWILTDDGHTIFTDAPYGDAQYNHCWTRLGNPANSERINGVMYMESFRMYNVFPGQNSTGYFRRSFLNGAVRGFASIRSNNIKAAARVVELTNSSISVTIDEIGNSGGGGASVDILIFGSYRYDQT